MLRRVALGSILVLLLVVTSPAIAQIAGTRWFPIGPKPIGGFFSGGVAGRATAIAVNPSDTNQIWLGTAGGGVWHTIDGGANWFPTSDKEDSLAIGAVAVDDCSSFGCNVIYAGTGENAVRRDTYYGRGLLVGQSIAGAISWKLRTGKPFDFSFGSINDVVLDPATIGRDKRIFITLSTGVTAASPESTVTAPAPSGGVGIYRSDDDGLTWQKLTVAGSGPALPTDLEDGSEQSPTSSSPASPAEECSGRWTAATHGARSTEASRRPPDVRSRRCPTSASSRSTTSRSPSRPISGA